MSNTKNDNPCYGCTERYVDVEHGTTCHSTCERHKEAKAKLDERKRIIAEKKAVEDIYRGYLGKEIAKYKIWRNKK